MELRPLRFLWKQLNGPQITAIFTAIFKYVQDQLNGHIRYYSDFSISTANENHLTLIGTCSGVPRPLIVLADDSQFIFTYTDEHGVDYGASAAPGPDQVGGKFTDLYQDLIKRKKVECPAAYYRPALLTFVNTSASYGTIAFIDDLLYTCWSIGHPSTTPTYRVNFMNSVYPGNNLTYSDVQIHLGDKDDWGGADGALMWKTLIEGLLNGRWGGNQRCEVIFN